MLALCSDSPLQHLAAGLDGRADDVGGRGVHVLEDRVVVAAETVLGVLATLGAHAGDGRDQLWVWTVAIRSSSAIGAARR